MKSHFQLCKSYNLKWRRSISIGNKLVCLSGKRLNFDFFYFTFIFHISFCIFNQHFKYERKQKKKKYERKKKEDMLVHVQSTL